MKLSHIHTHTFDPPIVINSGEQVNLHFRQSAAGLEVTSAVVEKVPMLEGKAMRDAVMNVMRQAGDTSVGDLEDNLISLGHDFERAEFRHAVWSLVGARVLDMTPESIITLPKPQE